MGISRHPIMDEVDACGAVSIASDGTSLTIDGASIVGVDRMAPMSGLEGLSESIVDVTDRLEKLETFKSGEPELINTERIKIIDKILSDTSSAAKINEMISTINRISMFLNRIPKNLIGIEDGLPVTRQIDIPPKKITKKAEEKEAKKRSDSFMDLLEDV